MKTLIGIVTFGNLDFTKLAVRGIRETTCRPADIFIIIGQPGDTETMPWCQAEGLAYRVHARNKGFPASINDIYDTAFQRGTCDAVILMGNDVVPYPGAIDEMIRLAEESDWEWICASQFDSKSLVDRYPEARSCFHGENLAFTDFAARPWMLHEAVRVRELEGRMHVIEPDCIKDVRNLCLFKRSVFDKLGYADVNFWPGGYFEDNDYCRRALLSGIRACGLPRAAYFHFWSRTIHQGSGSTTARQFDANRRFYEAKWGGPVNAEQFDRPFNGHAFLLDGSVDAALPVSLHSRMLEPAMIRHWQERQG